MFLLPRVFVRFLSFLLKIQRNKRIQRESTKNIDPAKRSNNANNRKSRYHTTIYIPPSTISATFFPLIPSVNRILLFLYHWSIDYIPPPPLYSPLVAVSSCFKLYPTPTAKRWKLEILARFIYWYDALVTQSISLRNDSFIERARIHCIIKVNF